MKDNVIFYCNAEYFLNSNSAFISDGFFSPNKDTNLKLIFDAKTGNLISANVMEIYNEHNPQIKD